MGVVWKWTWSGLVLEVEMNPNGDGRCRAYAQHGPTGHHVALVGDAAFSVARELGVLSRRFNLTEHEADELEMKINEALQLNGQYQESPLR